MLLQTAIERYLEYFEFEQRGSKNTITSRYYGLHRFRRHLEERYGVSDLQEVGINHLRGYLAYLRVEAGNKPISLHSVISDLRAFYKFAAARGLVPVDLAKRLKKPHVEQKEIEHFTWEEAEAIFLSVQPGPRYLRDLCILLLFYYCGIRLSELRALRMGDFSENFSELYVEMSKGDKARLLPIHPFLQRVLPLYFRERERERISSGTSSSSSSSSSASPGSSSSVSASVSDFLFPGRGDGPLSKFRIYAIVKQCGERAGVKKRVSPHTFRHTFATHLHQKGVDINRLAELLGHSNIEKTAVYTHTDDSELTAAVLKLKEGRVVWRIEEGGTQR